MSEWQTDLKKAPRDGTHFLIKDGNFVAAAFFKPNKVPKAKQPVTMQIMTRRDRYTAATGLVYPTHWAPMPPPYTEV